MGLDITLTNNQYDVWGSEVTFANIYFSLIINHFIQLKTAELTHFDAKQKIVKRRVEGMVAQVSISGNGVFGKHKLYASSRKFIA